MMRSFCSESFQLKIMAGRGEHGARGRCVVHVAVALALGVDEADAQRRRPRPGDAAPPSIEANSAAHRLRVFVPWCTVATFEILNALAPGDGS